MLSVNEQFQPNLLPFRPNLLPFRPNLLPITFLSLKNKGFQRPELIELLEQERATPVFLKILGWFSRLNHPHRQNERSQSLRKWGEHQQPSFDLTVEASKKSTKHFPKDFENEDR